MDMTQATLIDQIHAQGQLLDTERMLHAAIQWGDHKTITHVYGRKDEI